MYTSGKASAKNSTGTSKIIGGFNVGFFSLFHIRLFSPVPILPYVRWDGNSEGIAGPGADGSVTVIKLTSVSPAPGKFNRNEQKYEIFLYSKRPEHPEGNRLLHCL